MAITLDQILDLTGKLDDTPGDDTPRERFRTFLQKNVDEPGPLRDYIQECLLNTGDQYHRALQDLVNHLGTFLGFQVTFGRYQGTKGNNNFDGYWKSPAGFHIVAEVKTTETYAIKTATLVGYVDHLISDKIIPGWEDTLGLYIVGRPDPEVTQLENSIVAEKRTDRLRVISVESLLSLSELMSAYDVNHDDILAVLRPSTPKIDSIIGLMSRLVGQREAESAVPIEVPKAPAIRQSDGNYWLSPVRSDEQQTGEQVVQKLVGQHKIYAFGDKTPGRKAIKPGDWICFYASGKGVLAHAKVASAPGRKPHSAVRHSDQYPWVFHLQDAELYLDEPVVIDAQLRSKLDAFADGDPGKSWGRFVQATRPLTAHDFEMLTRR